MSSISLFESGC